MENSPKIINIEEDKKSKLVVESDDNADDEQHNSSDDNNTDDEQHNSSDDNTDDDDDDDDDEEQHNAKRLKLDESDGSDNSDSDNEVDASGKENPRKISLVSTTIDLSHINFPEGDNEYIVALYINRGWGNTKVSFFDLKTSIDNLETLILKIFKEFKYKLPSNEKITRCTKTHIGIEDDKYLINLASDHAYIYCSKKININEKYENTFVDVSKYIFRSDKTNNPLNKCCIQ